MKNRWGNNGNSGRLCFGGLQNYCRWWLQPWQKKKKMLAPWKKSYDQPRQHIKKQRHYFANKVHLVKVLGFPVVMMDMRVGLYKSWVLNWYFWAVVLEKTLESPLDCKEIQPVNPKRNQSWIFIERTDAEAEAPTLWPPEVKNWLIGKDPDAGKDWVQEEKEMTEDKMVGWHHQLDGHESEQALGGGDGQGSLACCSPWGRKELGTKLNNNKMVLSFCAYIFSCPLDKCLKFNCWVIGLLHV